MDDRLDNISFFMYMWLILDNQCFIFANYVV